MKTKNWVIREQNIKILPDEDIFNNWREIIFFSSGIPFSLDVVKAAYFMNIGYRAAMNKYSPHSFTIAKESPWKCSVDGFMTHNNIENEDRWADDLDTDMINLLISHCCVIQFGMEHPLFGDSDEYKKTFRDLCDKYCNENKF